MTLDRQACMPYCLSLSSFAIGAAPAKTLTCMTAWKACPLCCWMQSVCHQGQGNIWGCVVQMHNQAKSSVTSSLEKVQAGKEKKEQELLAAHQALEETNKKLQVPPPPRLTHFAILHLAPLSRPHPSVCIHIPQYLSSVLEQLGDRVQAVKYYITAVIAHFTLGNGSNCFVSCI